MALRPLDQSVCDYCGDVIDELAHGWVEWLVERESSRAESGYPIVHQAAHSPRDTKKI